MTNILSRRGNRFIQAATATLVIFAATAPAGAMERFRSDTQPCAAVQQQLGQHGAAIIQYESTRIDNYLLYDRYVAANAYCEPGEQMVQATVISIDDPTCSVNRCVGDSSTNHSAPNRRTTLR